MSTKTKMNPETIADTCAISIGGKEYLLPEPMARDVIRGKVTYTALDEADQTESIMSVIILYWVMRRTGNMPCDFESFYDGLTMADLVGGLNAYFEHFRDVLPAI